MIRKENIHNELNLIDWKKMFLLTISMWEYVRLHLTQITVAIKDDYSGACVGEFCVAIWYTSPGSYFG